MNILVLGQGGREHALCWRLRKDSSCKQVFSIPGNYGIARSGVETFDISLEDFNGIHQFCLDYKVDLIIVGPEDPLDLGIVDFFKERNIPIVGPKLASSKLESSKAYSKAIMKKYGIPTADYRVFTDSILAKEYIDSLKKEDVVIKASSLAGGKGVVVCNTKSEAKEAIYDLLENPSFSVKTSEIVIEERLYGEEVSAFALYDKDTFVTLGFAKDHKRLLDGDLGPNTGGMGTFSCDSLVSEEFKKKVESEVFNPLLEGMKKEGRPYTGVLFAGLMLTDDDINVIEFNVRLGDPETQSLLPRFEGDLCQLLLDQATDKLSNRDNRFIPFSKKTSVHVVMASNNYPALNKEKLDLGHDIYINEEHDGTIIFYSGVSKGAGVSKLVNSGGRVLGVTALADDLMSARERVYHQIKNIDFKNAHYRKDIALES